MSHQAENARPLRIGVCEASTLDELPAPNASAPEVWLFILPFGRTIADAECSQTWFKVIQSFSASMNEQSVLAILTSPQDAAETWPHLKGEVNYQLWISIKLHEAVSLSGQELAEDHAALLILSKYRTSLRHNKTRLAYSFCPACDKTTKDYGGKKHTYHEYGTLISDVWRDIQYTPGENPTAIISRLADLFGLEPYERLNAVNLRGIRQIQPKRGPTSTPRTTQKKTSSCLESRLIHGDVLAELRALPADSVDFCFADPPYNLNKRYDSWDDTIDAKKYMDWCDEWIDELARVLRPGCTCAVLNIPILAMRHFQHMKQSLDFQAWIAWEGLSLPVRMIMPAHYSIVCFSKGTPRPLPALTPRTRGVVESQALSTLRENYCVRQSCVAMRRRARLPDRQPITDLWWDIHRLKHNSRRVDHPCQLPPALVWRLISLFTAEGELVLDPFNGAGTTTLCADAIGRRYIGIELSDNYHALAASRHALQRDGGDPFEKARGVPKAKNSRVERIGSGKYEVPKKTLQLEVKRVAGVLGRLPSREELERHGRFPIRYYDEYFISWGEVCAAARTTGMSETRAQEKQPVPNFEPMLFG